MIASGNVTVGGNRQVIGPFDLPDQTATLRLALNRPMTGNSVDWDEAVKITSWIVCDIDGVRTAAQFSANGGIATHHRVGEMPQSTLSWTLPWGFFDTDKVDPKDHHTLRAKRFGETALTSFKVWIEIEGDGAATVSYELTADVQPAPSTLRYHHSIAFENATSVFESVGDTDVSVSFTANSGSNRAACVGFSNDRENADTTHTVTWGGVAPTIARSWDAAGSYCDCTGDTFLDSQIGSGAKTVRGVGAGGSGGVGGCGLTVVVMSGVNQTTPVGTGVSFFSNGGGGGPSVTVTGLNATDLIVDSVYTWDGGAITAGANQTTRVQTVDSIVGPQSISSSTQSGADGGVMSWSALAGEWSIGAVAYKQAPPIAATLKFSATGFYVNVSGPVTYTTGSFTTDNNSLLVVCIDAISDNVGGAQVNCSLSSSPSLTWTRQARAASTGTATPCASEIWTAPVTTGASTTITVSASFGFIFHDDGTSSAISVTSVTGHDTVGNPIGLSATNSVNGSNTGTLSVSLGGTTASTSLVIATVSCDGDYGAASVSPGTSWTALQQANSGTSGWYRSTTEYRIGALSTYDFGALNDPYQHTSAGLEIKAPGTTTTAYTLTAAAGSYALTGSAATLTYVPSITAVTPLLVGRGRTLKRPWLRNRILPPPAPVLNAYVLDATTAGSYALTGTAATLIRGRVIPPNPVFVPGHALLTNMLACYLPGVYGGVPVSGTGPTLANGAGGAGTVVSTIEGPALRSNTLGAAKGLTATAPSAFKTWTNSTIYWRGVIIGAGDAFCPLLGISATSSDVAPYFMVNVATTASGYVQLQAYYGDSSTSEVTPALDVTGQYGSIIDVAVTVTVGGSVTFYVNGVSVGTNTMSVISTSDATSKIVINQGIDATNRSPNASANMACFWDRALSSGEVLGLHGDPYAFLTSGQTIAAGAGAYALTGTAATLIRGKNIAAGAGAYALTGTAAALLRGLKIAATTAGAYALTGTAVALLRGRKIDATTAGAYALTGTAAALLRGRKIDATTAGAYALTGTAAVLIKAAQRTLVANTGNYALTGTAATLIRGRILAATTAGAYALTGTATTLIRGKNIAAGAGAYALTGTAATLIRGKNIVAGAGAYALTGTAATLRKGKLLAATTAGAYVLTGSAVLLRKKTLIAAAGSYALTGTAVTLIRGKNITAGAGAYVLTGSAVTLTKLRAFVLTATTSGAYALTGTAATLSKLVPRTLVPNPGAYALTGAATTNLVYNHKIAAAAGAYALTGSTATDPTIGLWRWVGISSVVSTTGTSHVLNLPAGTQAGDLLVAFISSRIASTTAITMPAGWGNAGQRSISNIVSGSLGQPTAKISYIVRGASDPDTTFTHPVAPSIAMGVIVAYRNVRQTSPLDASNFGSTATNVTAVSVSGVSPSFVGDLIVAGIAGGAPNSYSSINAFSPGIAATGSNETRHPKYYMWSERIDVSDATGAGTSIAVADAVNQTTSSTGSITATASVATGHAIVTAAFRFSPGKTIVAGTASYDLTGSPATLIAPHVIDATTAGSYALTGSDVALVKRTNRILTADPGSYTLRGTAVTLTKLLTLTLVAGGGSYALTGTAVTFLRGRKIAATTAGAYVLTGSAVTLTKLTARTLAAGAGGYALTGTATTLKRSRIHIAGIGAYALTGAMDVQLRKVTAGAIVASAGSYVLTGAATTSFKRGRTIKAGYHEVMWEVATAAGVTLSNGNLTATNTGTTSANQGAHVAAWEDA